MAAPLEQSIKRLDAALDGLEAAVSRRLEVRGRRGDLDTELQLMQDDRSRLAVELESATARLQRMEAVTDDVGRRVGRAMTAIREALASAAATPGEQV